MTEWIPCTEAIPEENQQVLLTVTDGGTPYVITASIVDDRWRGLLSNAIPVAWMPLPDPYAPVIYRLITWKYGMKADDYTTSSLDDLRSYYRDKWRWEEADCNCFCELYVNGEWIDIDETDRILDGKPAI